MNTQVLGVGVSGTLPEHHPFQDLAKAGGVSTGQPELIPMLRRERKVRVIVEAAYRAIGAIQNEPDALRGCGFVLVTRYDGRPAIVVDEDTGGIISFGALPPSTVALSLVPHVAASCVLSVCCLQGPAVSIASRRGLFAAWRIAERWLAKSRGPVLVVESDLAMPDGIAGAGPATDYALAALIGHPTR